MDYSICQALEYRSEGLINALVIYDIACQWNRHFLKQVEQSPYLKLKDWKKFIPAVGKFHLAAHVPSCFSQYSLNFIEGAGQQDGEILETLWAEFNKVSNMARTMSKAHRREIYDDYMGDSNWTKLLQLGTPFSQYSTNENFIVLYFSQCTQE
jgi:hypothetical protein